MHSQPAEVVQTILRYVIGVPILFDLERLPNTPDYSRLMVNFYSEASIFANVKAYWDSERNRNASRRVCKAWDAYLRPFEHRLVHLEDVFGTWIVPVKSISKALYISPTSNGRGYSPPYYKDRFFAVLRQLKTPIRVRVLFLPFEDLSREDVSSLAQWAPQLRTAISLHGLSGPLRDFPTLAHGSISIRTSNSLDLLCNLPMTLRSLSIKIYTGDAKIANLSETNIAPGPLPSLDFLCVWIGSQEDARILRRILQTTFGSRITALQLIISPRTRPEVDDILDLCPRLQVLHPSIFAYYKISRPNAHRQLQTLIVSLLETGLVQPIKAEDLLVWPKWTRIRRFISTEQWHKLHKWSLSDLAAWASLWEGSPVRIEDRDGISIQEWLGSNRETHG